MCGGGVLTVTATDAIRLLQWRYNDGQWATFQEVRDSLGFAHRRSIDFLAINCWPSKNYERVAVEIKVSRADFNREIRDPSKREAFEKICHTFWFCAPEGVVPVDKVPVGCGLIEIVEGIGIRGAPGLRETVKADLREVDDPPIDFWVSLMRQTARKIGRRQEATR